MPRVPSSVNWAFPVLPPARSNIGGVQFGPPGISGLETFKQSIAASDRMLSNAFSQIDGAANQIEELGNSLHAMNQQSTLNSQQLSFYEKLNDLKLRYSERTDFGNLEDDFKKETSTLTKDYGKGLTGPYMEKFRTSMLADIGKAYVDVKRRARDGQVDSYRASLLVAEDYHSRRAAEGNDEISQAHQAEFQQKVYGAFAIGAINEVDMESKVQKFNERVDLIKSRQAINKDPARALISLSDPTYYSNLDPMQREQMKEHARAKLEQQQWAFIREANRAENEYKKKIRKQGAAVMAEAAGGGVTLDQLRDLLHNDEINITDYNHARSLLKEFAKGDIITNQNSYFSLYRNILDGTSSKDDVVNSKDIAPEDKIKLLDKIEQKTHTNDISHQPDYKNDVKIIDANVRVKGPLGAIEPRFAQAYAYAVTHYDRRRREGVDPAIALQEAINFYKTDMQGTEFMPLPMFGTVHDDTKDLGLRLKQKFDDKTIPIDIYQSELQKLIQIKRIKDAKLFKTKEITSQ